MADGRFWYRDRGADGLTFTLVDPAKKTKAPAFDQAKLAAAMGDGQGDKGTYSARSLPIDDFTLADGDKTVIAHDGRDELELRPERGG